ncbi:hypothetical protein Lal_00001771 [Lupinus albus]|uniref:Uncharacterized protein n=1 Tax=Lupinus albus TaxID=3870 RepID=A0A6A5P755_LUPAL|nr:hypothetical protein Lalb_Chr11g0067381 [Lupinus albus]KAF1893315.1 hypothetical protein Lal_00001771 [Lupinus albus]
MATGTIYAAVPAVVAAVGFYFIDTNFVKELRRGISATNQSMIDEVNEQMETLQKPKVAPQLDGLHCFETLIIN